MYRLLAFFVVLLLLFALGVSLLHDTVLRPGDCLSRLRPAAEGRFAAVIQELPDSLLIEYDDGVELRVRSKPRTIVSALPGITEIIAYLGAVDRLIAVSPHCDTPPRVAQLRKINVQPLDIEALLDLRPDLVVLDRGMHGRAIADARRQLGNVLVLDTSRSLAHLRTSVHLLARVLDEPEATKRAKEWIRSLQDLESDLATKRLVPAPRVLIVAQWDPVYVMGPDSLLDDMMRACGFINVACDLMAGDSGPFSEELILERKPDWILMPVADMPERLRERWANVPAVAQDHFVDASTDDVVRGGPRILEGLASLARELLREDSR